MVHVTIVAVRGGRCRVDFTAGMSLDLAAVDHSLESSLTFLRHRFRQSELPSMGGWYHQLDMPLPGPTATAVGLDIYTQLGEEFERFNECLAFLRSRQVNSPDPALDGGWSTNTSFGCPVIEATGWVAYSLGAARVDLLDESPSMSRAYRWICENQNPDGGWGSMRGCPSRVWLTCLGLRSLRQLNPHSSAINRGQNWLMAHLNQDTGAWGETPGSAPTVTHTAFVLLTLMEVHEGWRDERILKAYDWLEKNLDCGSIDDRNARVENYNVTAETDTGRVVWHTVMPHYGLPIAASALLRHPNGAPAGQLGTAFRTILDAQLDNGSWPNIQGGASESIWAVAPFVRALQDVRVITPAKSRDQILWSPSIVVIQRAGVRDQPLAAIIRAQRRAAVARTFSRHWTSMLLAASALLGIALIGTGRFDWKDYSLGLIMPIGLFAIEQFKNRRTI